MQPSIHSPMQQCIDDCLHCYRTCMESCRQMAQGLDLGNFTGQARGTDSLRDRLPM